MHNRSLISFIANILIGIIFILPVYSYSANQFDFHNETSCYGNSGTENTSTVFKSICTSNLENSNNYFAVLPVHIKKSLLSFKKDSNSLIGFLNLFKNTLPKVDEYSPPLHGTYIHNYFSKITFLNSLGTIKLLC